ncbi:serine/threonine-protein kinase [Catenulispora yoronensis]
MHISGGWRGLRCHVEAVSADQARRVGQYRVIAELGRGGMGRVLLASGGDGRLVAVKTVHAALAADKDFRKRFRHEVAASRRVSGAYTVAVVDADADAETPWLASVFVRGPALSSVLAECGPLPYEAVRRLAAGLARALIEVHRVGLVHRDLKPSNILLAEDGPRVIDFGIARAADQPFGSAVTGTGFLIGSPGYMAPEQAEGRTATAASDVFALGAVLFAACTAQDLFRGPGVPQILYNVVHQEPDLDAVHPRLRALVASCLAKDPAARPDPAGILAEIGTLAPTSKPWPAAVYSLIDAQNSAIDEVLSRYSDDDSDDDSSSDSADTPVPSASVATEPALTLDAEAIPEPAAAPPSTSTDTRHLTRRSALTIGILAVGATGVAVKSLWPSPTHSPHTKGPAAPTSPSTSGTTPTTTTTTAPTAPSSPTPNPADPRTITVLTDTQNGLYSVQDVAFSADGQTVFTRTSTGNVQLWNTKTLKETGSAFTADAGSMALTRDTRILATASVDPGDDTITLWDTASRKRIGVPMTPSEGNNVRSLAFSPDGTLLAAGYDEDLVRLWTVPDGRQFGKTIGDPTDPGGTWATTIRAVAFSSDGKILATGGTGDHDSHTRYVRLWNVATQAQIRSPIEINSVTALAFSPDDHMLAIDSNETGQSLWAVAGLTKISDNLSLPTPYTSGALSGIAFSPDGRSLAGGGANAASVVVWDPSTLKIVASLPSTASIINMVAFSPDSRTLAIANGDGTITLWQVPKPQ